jgi:hypothetical protein
MIKRKVLSLRGKIFINFYKRFHVEMFKIWVVTVERQAVT